MHIARRTTLQIAIATCLTIASMAPSALGQCSYETVVLADQPQAYWHLNGSGPTFIDLANSVGGPRPLTGSDPFMPSQPGAISGDANDRSVGIVMGGALYTTATDFPSFVSTAFTLEAWVRPEQPMGISNFKQIVGRFYGHQGNSIAYAGYSLQFRDNAVRLRTGAITDGDFNPLAPGFGSVDLPYTFAPNTWYHVVASADPTILTQGLPSVTLYVNGVSLGTVPYRSPTAPGGGTGPLPIYIGRGQYEGASWAGRVDEVAVYSHALNSVQVQQHFHAAGSNLVLTMQPASQTVCDGGTVEFGIAATASGPISYQWRHNLVNITGANSPSLAFPAASFADAGQYDCIVSTPCGSLASGTATLSVTNCGPIGGGSDTSFSYKAELNNSGVPAQGPHDMRFRLYTNEVGGQQVGEMLCVENLAVEEGRLLVMLDFGNVFSDTPRFLEIDIRADASFSCANPAGFTTLSPRQQISQVPQAIYAQTAGTALNVTDAQNTLTFGGQPPEYYTNLANTTGSLPSTSLGGTYNAPIALTNGTNAFSGSFTGSGAGLTGINAANITSGILPSSQLSGTYAGQVNLTNSSNYFTGDGAGLTALNASNLSSGTIADARLSGNVARRNIVQNFVVQQQFSVTTLFTDPAVPFVVTSPSLVANLNADLLDGLTSSDFGQRAATQTWPGAHTFSNPSNSFAGSFAGNASQLTNVNADLLDGLDSSAFLAGLPNPMILSGTTFEGVAQVTSYSGTVGSAALRVKMEGQGDQLGNRYAVYASTPHEDIVPIFGESTLGGDYHTTGVYGRVMSEFGVGVRGYSGATVGNTVGVLGQAESNTFDSVGVRGLATGGRGVWGSSAANEGVYATSGSGVGLRAESQTNDGIFVSTDTGGSAIYAIKTSNGNFGGLGGFSAGGYAFSSSGDGFIATSTAAGKSGIYCVNTQPDGNAIYAQGDGYLTGELSVGVLTIRGGADLAEPFDIAPATSHAPTAGMVVAIDPARPGKLRVCDIAYDTKVAGIISGANGLAPGLTLRAQDHLHADGEYAVAMTGRVWCLADATLGAITPGDRLTTSATPGHAMKARDTAKSDGAVIGKAMTPLAKGERGLVLVLVNLQ